MIKNNKIVKNLFLGSLLTMILAASVSLLGMIIDGVVISRFLGYSAMSAYGIVSPLFVLLSAISGILGSGTQTKCGRAVGKGNYNEAENIFSTGIISAIAISAILIVSLGAFSDQIAAILGAAGKAAELAPDVKAYLYGLLPAIPFMCLTTILSSMMYIEGNKKLTLKATSVSCIVNVSGDLLCALVIHNGMFGMAIATSCSYVVSTAVLLTHYRKPPIIKFGLQKFGFSYFTQIVSTGLPQAINRACNMLRSVVLNHLLLAISTSVAVAAFSIRTNINNLYSSIAIGIGMSTLVIGSLFFGEEDKDNLKALFKMAIKWGFGINAVICTIICIFANPLVAIYTSDPEVAPMAVMSLILYAISVPLYTVVTVFTNYYQAIGKKLVTNILCTLDNFAYVCLAALVLGNLIGVNGVWASFLVCEICTLITIYIFTWVECGHMPRCLEDFMILPEDFVDNKDDSYRVSCEDLESVIKCSNEIKEFLMDHGVDETRSGQISLFVEELGTNIIRWGFKDKKNAIDIYMTKKAGKWTLCVRDNCSKFDPQKWYEIHKNENENLGIKIVFGLAEDIKYSSALNLNSVIIRI